MREQACRMCVHNNERAAVVGASTSKHVLISPPLSLGSGGLYTSFHQADGTIVVSFAGLRSTAIVVVVTGTSVISIPLLSSPHEQT